MGKISLGIRCSVERCADEAVRSISLEKIKAAGLPVKQDKRAYLCKLHYKEFKKKLKAESRIEKWRRR